MLGVPMGTPSPKNRIGWLGIMRFSKRAGLGLLLMLLFGITMEARDLRDPVFMNRAEAGFEYIFNLDYNEAKAVFAILEKEYPMHPAPPLYQAVIFWLEEMLRRQDLTLNRFTAPAYFSWKTDQSMPPRERAAFFKAVQKSESLSFEILKENRGDKDARYFLATALGLRSSFAITIDHSLRESFSNGNKAYSYARGLIEQDPQYYDAYLIAGVYEYVVGSIPWYLKWMVFMLGARGNKSDGFADLKLAAERGQYAKNEALLVAMVFYVRERQYAEALEIARGLSVRYQRNFLFPLNSAQILQMSGNKEDAISLLLRIVKRAEAGEPNFDKLSLQTLRFNLGTELINAGKLDAAAEQFRKCIDDPKTPSKEKTLSHLNLGTILELKGQGGEAAREYQAVLALEDVENSHRQAKRLLRKIARR